jgi:hypothetical protein
MTTPGPVVTNYGYDYENRLTSVTSPTYTANYTYAADGLRLRIQESNNPYPDRYFQYDGVRPVLEGTLSEDTFTTLNRYVLEGNSYYDPLISAFIGGSPLAEPALPVRHAAAMVSTPPMYETSASGMRTLPSACW